MVRVRLPPDFRRPTDPSVVEIKTSNLAQLVGELDRRVPGIKAELNNESGEIRASLYDFFSMARTPTRVHKDCSEGRR